MKFRDDDELAGRSVFDRLTCVVPVPAVEVVGSATEVVVEPDALDG